MKPKDHKRSRYSGPSAAGHSHASHKQHQHQHQHKQQQAHQTHPHHDARAKHAAPHAKAHGGRRHWIRFRHIVVLTLRRPIITRMFWGATFTFVLVVVAALSLWWRLARGPIEFDLATPWLKAAIEENFGGQHTVTVGGTQLERDENGRPALRLRNIVVRDADGTVVASAPKAEVGISGLALLHGQVRARSLNLVGAKMAVRIEKNGTVIVFAGANKRPIATASPLHAAAQKNGTFNSGVPQGALRTGVEELTGLMAWIDDLGATGLDGHDLRELGLKNGSLTVDDERNGKHWTFSQINVSLMRPDEGGLMFRIASENPKRPWVLSAAMRPLAHGVRAIGLEARNVSTADLLLAMRLNEGEIHADLPLSASVRAEVSADDVLQRLQGQVIAGRGAVVDRIDDNVTLPIEGADIRFSWQAQQRALIVPFQIRSGGNQFTMQAILRAPVKQSGVWTFKVTRADQVIDPIILDSAGKSDQEGFAINRVSMSGSIDTKHHRIDLDKGDLSRVDTRPAYNVGIAVTGSFDYGAAPYLAFGIACTHMPGSVLKRVWPIFAAYPVRQWVEDHVFGGTVERVVIAGNAPLADFRANGPAMPEDGLSIALDTNGTTLHPIANLPAVHDADLTVRIVGHHAIISLGRGTVDVPGGRKLNIANGFFDVPNVHPKPADAIARFRVDGAVPAMAALLTSPGIRDRIGGLVLDPESTQGTVDARVNVNLQIATKVPTKPPSYAISADLTNFAADKMLFGHKVEASSLKVTATKDSYRIKGNVKISGIPASLEVKKQGHEDARLYLQAKLDDAARRRLGIDLGNALSGTIPVSVTGTLGQNSGLSVETDLTPVKIDNLLPGWVKPAGAPEHASYKLDKTDKTVRFDDLVIGGSGVNVKGAVELDKAGDILSANFPVFALSSGDKASLKAERGKSGVLHVTMRGEIYDGRNFIKSVLAGSKPERTKHKETDLNLDIKIGTVAGFNGETLRGLDLKMSRRGGQIRSFFMKSTIGRDTPLVGDLRLRVADKHRVIFFQTDNAGALFRFTNMYPRMYGGKMWVAMDPPRADQKPQIGMLYISNFTVRGEPTLEKVAAGAPGQPHGSVHFSEMHADFTRLPGKMLVRDGVVRGSAMGGTVEGQIDYAKNDIHLRGTFVPFYGLNNLFGQIPVVGLILGGGSNEGLVGITYEAVGPPSAPRIIINPVSAITPGLLRKFIPSPGDFDPKFNPMQR